MHPQGRPRRATCSPSFGLGGKMGFGDGIDPPLGTHLVKMDEIRLVRTIVL
ncbi:hypothetical protein J6590_029757 [Homalodisca vitripennis]|nr:hypothetical protein J6590_029757 [Homalodisca vitripennis]